jgi:hypothetical protein
MHALSPEAPRLRAGCPWLARSPCPQAGQGERHRPMRRYRLQAVRTCRRRRRQVPEASRAAARRW